MEENIFLVTVRVEKRNNESEGSFVNRMATVVRCSGFQSLPAEEGEVQSITVTKEGMPAVTTACDE